MPRDGMEERIEELLGGLQKVDAPVGFEEGVMRRITGSGSGERSRGPMLLLGLKFAVPAAVLLLMGAMFVFFGGREPDVASVPPVVSVPPLAASSPASSHNHRITRCSTTVPVGDISQTAAELLTAAVTISVQIAAVAGAETWCPMYIGCIR